MTARSLTILGFWVLAVVLVAVTVAGRTDRLGLVSPGEILNVLRARMPVRLAIVLGWAWLGWHFLAR